MKISMFSNNGSMNNINKQQQANNSKVAFKAVYLEDSVDLGQAAEKGYPARFLKKDALLINEIAQKYPNQDCFIRRGHGGYPKLEFREKPPVVQGFTSGLLGEYKTKIDSKNEDYPCVPLILKDGSPINQIIGLPSYISLNPSLPYTIKAGFELHKKLLAKRDEIMELMGMTDEVNLGKSNIMEIAHNEIKEYEEAVTRYLLESAYLVLSDKPNAEDIYNSDIPRVQQLLTQKRKLDLTTSVANQKAPKEQNEVDICEEAVTIYRTRAAEETEAKRGSGKKVVSNAEAIDTLSKTMLSKNLTLK